MNIEDELRLALRREPAPPGFQGKVVAKAKARTAPRRWPAIFAIAAAIALAAVVPPAISEYQHRTEARGMEARRELFIALSVTRSKLQQTRERIQRGARHTTGHQTL